MPQASPENPRVQGGWWALHGGAGSAGLLHSICVVLSTWCPAVGCWLQPSAQQEAHQRECPSCGVGLAGLKVTPP